MKLTSYQKQRLDEFDINLRSNGVVSKSMVLGLEEALGVTLITKKYSIDKVTAEPTRSGVDDILAIVDESKLYIILTDIVTPTEIINLTLANNSLINTIISEFKILKEMPVEVLDRMCNERYTSYYDNEVFTTLDDKIPLMDVFKYHRDYLMALLSINPNPEARFDRITELLLNWTSMDGYLEDNNITFLNICLKGSEITNTIVANEAFVKIITIRDVVDIIKNMEVIIEALSSSYFKASPVQLTNSTDMLSRKDGNQVYIYMSDTKTNKKINMDVTKLKNINAILKDPQLWLVIEILKVIAK